MTCPRFSSFAATTQGGLSLPRYVAILAESAGTQNNGASNSGFRITRYKHTSASTTELHTGNAYANPGGIRSLVPMFSNYLDQPSTTEQLTYAVDFKTQNSGGLGTASYGACGSITVLEIT